MYHNFVKIAAAIPVVEVADCQTNAERIFELVQDAENQGVELVSFPELCITGYTSGDLFLNSTLLKNAENALSFLLEKTKNFQIISIVGMPVKVDNQLFNCAVVFQQGEILGVIPKTYRPNNNEFYEHRWFASALDVNQQNIFLSEKNVIFGKKILFINVNFNFSVEICEDLWAVVPPSSFQALAGSHIIFNLSASNELVGKNDYRKQLVAQQSGRCNAGYVYVSAGFGESSTDLLFASSALIAENGAILAESEKFSIDKQLIISEIDIERLKNERLKNDSFKRNNNSNDYYKTKFLIPYSNHINLTRKIDKFPFVPRGKDLEERCREIFNIQVNALAIRLFHTKIDKVTIGVSGGLDSTLALLVTAAAFDKLKIPRENIFGITMPCFGTTARTKNNALSLMNVLKITSKEISIEKAVLQHFSDIEQSVDNQNVTYENCQARERTQVLMDYANKIGGMVVGTGDMSELALGWATYNGDHISMYGVNSGVPKTLVRHLVRWIADNKTDEKTANILLDVIDTPISPELLPAKDGEIVQKTEEVVGSYNLHDFFLYYFLRFGFSPEKILFLAKNAFCENQNSEEEKFYTEEEIKKWLKVFIKRFFTNQFKRSCMPDGVKVGSINLSPRGDWRMPSDASAKEWLNFN
ncbi:MAG: NAD(+) synthase [Prevotellaceae bacterium]|jgi:NAD+ synthase (glutamine-hydrolysing)|nr:NAD(+) synthase [Prevotellaceae bacterium]